MSHAELVRWKDVATIFSLIALPVILAVGSWVIQDRIATQGVQKDYVQLAVEILRQRELKDDGDSRQLRTWAVKVVDSYAPVKLTETEKSELVDKGLTWHSLAPTGLAYVYPDTSLPMIVLTREQCVQFAPFNNDKAWLDRCLARADELKKNLEQQPTVTIR
jgi:hypothetical protein